MFKKAFEKGLELAELGEAEDRAIGAVLTDLIRQISDLSFFETKDKFVLHVNDITICEIRYNRDIGFPVDVSWATLSCTVHDVEALNNYLCEMLSDVRTGLVIKRALAEVSDD